MILERSVALVGRPNVGKSRIFNRLVGRRVAIVHDMPGVTRDLATEMVNDDFQLMDTGGIGIKPEMTPEMIHDATEEQVDFAIQAAALVLFVVDGAEGLTTVDEDLADKLRRYNKQTLLVVNKIDVGGAVDRVQEFFSLGIEGTHRVSAEHGTGFSSLIEHIYKKLGPKPPEPPKAKGPRRARICLAGKPNVGKSSLGNRILNSERLIVSEVAGTTRDAIGADLDYQLDAETTLHFHLVDTAGLKPKRKLGSSLDYFSTLRSEEAIRRSDIVFLVLDAMTGVQKHDKKLAGEILEAGVGLVMVVNKWDLALEAFRREPVGTYKSEREFRMGFMDAVREELFFLPDSPVIFTSAKDNYHVGDIMTQAAAVSATLNMELPTGKINSLLKKLIEKKPPKLSRGKRFKIYYAVQTGNRPFRIRLFCNSEERFDDNYRRYLQTGFQKEFRLSGCPIRFDLVGKPGQNRELSITEYRKKAQRGKGKRK